MSVTASSVRRRPQCCSSGVLHLRLSFVLEGSRPSFTSSTHPSLLVKGGAQAALEPLLPSVSPSRPSTDWEEHENPSLQEMDEDIKLRYQFVLYSDTLVGMQRVIEDDDASGAALSLQIDMG